MYTNEAKTELLGVETSVLESACPVSAAAARQMALGALNRSRADLSIVVTGFAGDEPGPVHFALALRREGIHHAARHFGDVGRGPVRLFCLETCHRLIYDLTLETGVCASNVLAVED